MRANGMVEMDSYRLAAYTVPCPCYICGGGNNYDAELCPARRLSTTHR